ncbi:cell wall hydrolase [Aurantiacibacter zhengii]|nr:cell wall hydrolase [Aurantiacibacter zhengii]
MKFISKRTGAFALATMIFAASFGTALNGAVAQDAEPVALATVQAEQNNTQAPDAAPQVRFVMNEVVQELPEQPEDPEIQASDAASLRELVGHVDTSDTMSREMMCLAQAVYFESRGEPLDGQLAVARVIINRAESSAFPDDYCSVVTQRSQFSFVRGGRIPEPNRGTSAWTRAKAIARIAHRELWESPADDALYFHARHVSPRWAGRLTARATIENHVFYR